jgi:hypothetical protein
MTDSAEIFSRIESAAQDGAFGQNRRPTPSDAMLNAGNYKVGRVQAFGLNLAIEQPRNTYRTGIGKDGKRWTTRLAAHYGSISGTKGADGDAVDCFIGFYPQSEYAWVINQYVDGQWDEHKVCLGFPDAVSAQRAYLDSYEKCWPGLHSIVKASLTQLKWWLKNGNLTKPLRPEYLPFEGYESMNQRIAWDSAQNPINMTLDKVLYEIRRADAGENLVLDAVCMDDILEDADEILVFDALVSTYAGLERKMQALLNVMTRAGDTVKPMALQISEPFKQSGVAQVAVVFELSDGQTVSIFFHNPDVTPQKMAPGDSLVSWEWLLNKKDVTIVVAPERGLDLNVREVATRIMKLAEKNSAAFARANAKRAENVAAIESLKTEITALETELADAQHELEVAKQEYEDRLANAPEQPEPESAGAQTEQKSSAEQETEEQKAEERQARAIETLRNIANDPAEYAIKQRSLSELEAATLVINKDYKGALGALSATPSKERIYLVSEFRRLINESQLLESLPALAVSALSAIMASDYVPAKKRLELLIQSQPIEQKQDQTPPILQALIDIGWQNISVDGLIPAKNIGGGTKTVTNPDGTRRVSAKIENGELQATFAGKVLASAPMNAGLSPAENAKNLDDAVNAIDPNFVQPGGAEVVESDDNARMVAEPIAEGVLPPQATQHPPVPSTVEPQGPASNELDLSEDDVYAREDYLSVYEKSLNKFKEALQFQTVIDAEEREYEIDDDPLANFTDTAFIVEQAVREYGGTVVWGNFDASAYSGSVFDSVVSPGSIVGQIADKDGAIVARVRIEENGMMTLFKGETGLEQVADPTAVVAKIEAAVAAAFGGTENKISFKAPHELAAPMTDAEKADLDRAFKISEYNAAFQTVADKIRRAIADIDWKSIVDNYSANAAFRLLEKRGYDRTAITAAKEKLETAGIDTGILNYDEMTGWHAYGEAVDALRETGDKILDYGKKQLMSAGKAKLAALPEDASIEEKADAIFMAQGIEGGATSKIVEAIKNKDVGTLFSVLGNTDNKASRKLFEMATGITLAKTVKGTLQQIDEWAGITVEQRAQMNEEQRAAREANLALSGLKRAWNQLEYEKVKAGDQTVTMQEWVKDTFAAGFKEIKTSKKGVAVTYWVHNNKGESKGFLRSKVFNTFLKTVIDFGGLKKAFAALDIQVEEELTPVERVNAAYEFEASDDFKEWLAESVDKTEGSPFLTAKAMDQAAKANGATIEWGFFGGLTAEEAAHLFGTALDSAGDIPSYAQLLYDEWEKQLIDPVDENEVSQVFAPDDESQSLILDGVDQDGYVGKIKKGGEIVGRVDLGDNGKAMVFVGESGDRKVKFNSKVDGQLMEYMYSDDDASEMVNALFNVAANNPSSIEPEPATDVDADPEKPQEAEIAPTATESQELTQARAKLKKLMDLQQRMKDANKVIKSKKFDETQKIAQLAEQGFSEAQAIELMKPDFAGRIGFADYQLTNNNATIRNTQKRIAELEARETAQQRAASGNSQTSYEFEGGNIELNYGDDRLQVFFDRKPDSETISKLKSNGFKWSPTNVAWQRQLTDNAISTANYLFGTSIPTAASMVNQSETKNANESVPVPENSEQAVAQEVAPEGSEVQAEAVKSSFIAELSELKSETDIEAFDRKLDDIAGRIEAAGLMDELDAELNAAADRLTELLAEAEKAVV